MKRWTRKLLAGLLSFGMLLQVASPLSALAAKDVGSDTAELEVTLTPMYGGTPETQQINRETASIELGGETIRVAYDNDTYTLSGDKIGSYDPYSSATDEITIRGVNSGKDSANVKLAITIHGNLVVEDIHDLEVTKRVSVQNSVTCTGKVTMTASMLAQAGLIVKAGGDVILTGTSGGITIGENDTTAWGAEITSGGDVRIENDRGSTPVSGGILVHAAKNVTIKSSSQYALIRGSQKADITADTLTIISTNSNVGGPITFTPRSSSRDGYVIATGDSDTAATAVQLENKEYRVDEKYLYIGPQTDTTTKAGSLTFSNSETREAYSLIRYKDNRVAWENDKKPDGIDYAFYDSYDSTGNTYTLYGTLSLPIGTWIDVSCNYENYADRGTDSVTFNGENNVAIDAGVYINDANNVTIKTDGGSAAVVGFANISCSGNVEITNSGNGTALGRSNKVADILVVNSSAENVTVTANSSEPLVGDANLSNSGNVTLTNPSGPIANAYIEVSASEGDVKITGNSSEGLARFNCRPDYQKNTINAKSVTMYNEGGQISKTIVQVPSTEGYKYVAGESADDAGRIEKALESTETTYTGTDKYLYVGPGTPAPTPEHHHTLGDWQHDETNHWKTCSGCHKKVGEALHNFGEDGVCECGYKKPATTPDHQHTASAEWKYDATNHWHTCANCNKDVQLEMAAHNFGEDGKAEKCVDCEYANPDYVAPAPDDTGTVDSGSDAGGAVAAVLVGSAAVWGGYEIATRVILHNILPEGTAIPANRGQLALLVWNNAGRPAPVNEPAFADMDDADMAKAAQWCMEQGIMEAKTAETFKPEGWTPKLKVIEVWNKAFPKQ